MWKLVKGEIGYFGRVIFYTYVLFVILTIAVILVLNHNYTKYDTSYNPYELYDAMTTIPPIVIGVHIIFVLVMLFFEIREGRPRRVCHLPIKVSDAGYARILVPFCVMAFFSLLCLVCIGILLLEASIIDPLFRYYDVTRIPLAQIFIDMLHVFLLWLFGTYAIRLLSEWQGRLILLVWFGLFLIHSSILLIINERVARFLWDLQVWAFGELPRGLYVTFAFILVLCVVLQISFMKRKLYMN